MFIFVSVVFGVLVFFGLVLLIVIVGVSLVFLVFFVVLGVILFVSSFTIIVVEELMRFLDEFEVSRLVRVSMNVFEEIVKIMFKIIFKFLFIVVGLVFVVKIFRDYIRVMRRARIIIFFREEVRNFIFSERSFV